MDEQVERAYQALRARVWDADDGDDDEAHLRALSPTERAIYVTRELEDELADGGWYLVFANEDDALIEPAIEGYELLGCPAYAAHLREVRASGYGDDSDDDAGERLDDLFATLDGSEAARRRAITELVRAPLA